VLVDRIRKSIFKKVFGKAGLSPAVEGQTPNVVGNVLDVLFRKVGLAKVREAGLVINKERPLVIRMGERDYPVPGVNVDQMETFLYVSGKLHDAFRKGT
jgi:hypothetical protein